MKKLLFICICMGFATTLMSQTEDKKWNLGLHGGIVQYHGDLGHDFYKTDKTFYGFGGLSISRYLSRHLDANLLLTRGTLGYDSGGNAGFKSDFSSASLNLRIHLISPDYIIRPYLSAGVGAILFDNQLNFHEEKIDFALPTAGAGINFRLSPVMSLNIMETFLFTDGDSRDGKEAGKNDDFLFHTVGLTFNFGNKKDTDNDGVSDRKDNCPDSPAGIEVDQSGCPLDRDNDQVYDYLDQCPDQLGLKSLDGCPDRDNDGIADKNDRCPDTYGKTALNGCPDTDNDGITDADDNCPNTVAGSKVNSRGCYLDRDNDGVTDDVDRCPDVAGSMANKGCPEIAQKDIQMITYIGSKIFFENNSEKLKVASLSQLDELIKILSRYEAANLVIEGHTDSNGSDDFNLLLSQKRTESVSAYLISKGIPESRLSGVGLGENNPVATNTTTLGRAKNRRVELKTNY
jgi:OmpA-OmpF porin, OOP family